MPAVDRRNATFKKLLMGEYYGLEVRYIVHRCHPYPDFVVPLARALAREEFIRASPPPVLSDRIRKPEEMLIQVERP
jgi:hypothetical protein